MKARNPKKKINGDLELDQGLEVGLKLGVILVPNLHPSRNQNLGNESEANPDPARILDLAPSRDRTSTRDENLEPGRLKVLVQ